MIFSTGTDFIEELIKTPTPLFPLETSGMNILEGLYDICLYNYIELNKILNTVNNIITYYKYMKI